MPTDIQPVDSTVPNTPPDRSWARALPLTDVSPFAQVLLSATVASPDAAQALPVSAGALDAAARAESFLDSAGVQRVYWQAGWLPESLRSAGSQAWAEAVGQAASSTAVASLAGGASASGSIAQAISALQLGGAEAVESTSLSLSAFPRPVEDNGWGMHWIPTVSSSPEVVDRFVGELKEMGVKWVTFLNEGTNVGANDYLVQRLVENGMMPVMRVYTTGLDPIEGDLHGLVRHYRELGVQYFQLYNEPNLCYENDGSQPDVDRYLSVWLPAAREVIAAGGYPGFGALSPQGEYDDRQFLTDALREACAQGAGDVLRQSWLSMHNYAGDSALDDPDGFLRFRQYADILESELGQVIPIIGTEAGTYVSDSVTEVRQTSLVAGAYRYMAEQREPYCFAFSYWVVANKAGGGHDDAWEWQALITEDGRTSPIVCALKGMAERA